MKKDTNIRISLEDYRMLSRLAKQEGRTILGQFKAIVRSYNALMLLSLKK